MPDTKDCKDPLDLHSKPKVLDAQRALDTAWEHVEAYRKDIDADRRATAQSPKERGERPVLRDWMQDEDAELARRRDAAVAAGQDRQAVMAEAGLVSCFQVEFEMR
jgi:hypothetical protein